MLSESIAELLGREYLTEARNAGVLNVSRIANDVVTRQKCDADITQVIEYLIGLAAKEGLPVKLEQNQPRSGAKDFVTLSAAE